MIERLIAGGQTGADRGGLLAAMAVGIPHGGWCPKGRLAEDGIVPREFQLQETATSNYPDRTRRNVMEAGATLIFAPSPLVGGSRLTADAADLLGKPYLHVDLRSALTHTIEETAQFICEWLADLPTPVSVLNVAGIRESKAPGTQKLVQRVMTAVLRTARL